MWGRLFQRLQQRVERLLRQHVDFVDDVNLEAGAGGAILDILSNVSDFLDAPIAGAVDLQDIHVFAGSNVAAHFALIARSGSGTLDAIQRLGENSSRGGFADSPSAREEVGVGHAVALQSVD